VCEEELSEEEE
jgi:hypothetical protein